MVSPDDLLETFPLADGSGNPIGSKVDNQGTRRIAADIVIADCDQIDGFGRLRVADTDLIESLHFANTSHPLLVINSVTGSGTAAYNSATSSLRLSTTTSSSDTVIVQTKRYFRYNPGRSYIMTFSGNLGAAKTNVTQRGGYFDVNNGLFFQQTSAGLSVVIRTNASGSPVDTAVAQSAWNMDKLDGTGPSGVTLNPALHNLYVIDFLWHGAGRIRFGVISNGRIVYCHEVNGANTSASPYMRTPSLPLRVELNNTGTTASGTTLDLVCFAFQKESSDSLSAPYLFTASTKNTLLSLANTIVPLLSIRPKLLFNSLTNRIPIIPNNILVATTQQLAYIQVLLNPTLTGASFASVDTNSAVEADTTATAVSGGTLVKELYVPASSSLSSSAAASIISQLELLSLALNIAGNTQDILTIAGRSTAGGTNTVAQMDWVEYQ